MTVYEELVARGLIAQVTDEPLIRELVNNGKATFYIGFDPTADSLHVGHFLQLLVMRYMQMYGHRPIALIGGGTCMIGDPSGKADMRRIMPREEIDANGEKFKVTMKKLLDFSEGKAIMLNNADWLMELNYVNFLREVGWHFSVNKMLSADAFKVRMEALNKLAIGYNEKYVEWAEDALTETFFAKGKQISSIDIKYKHEIALDEFVKMPAEQRVVKIECAQDEQGAYCIRSVFANGQEGIQCIIK